MKIKTQQIGKWYLAEIRGNIRKAEDHFSFKEFLIEKICEGNHFVALDCSKVRYADSGFLSRVILAKQLLEDKGGRFCIIPSEFLTKLFRMSKLDKVFQQFESLSTFKTHLGASAK